MEEENRTQLQCHICPLANHHRSRARPQFLRELNQPQEEGKCNRCSLQPFSAFLPIQLGSEEWKKKIELNSGATSPPLANHHRSRARPQFLRELNQPQEEGKFGGRG
ncbi:hypothetical protein CDAR_67911 [Caerostris darwini]|uniref:Uncharacterized protein n=1 Tax=Caerostris darwini TaxID=1538125 RepID=A0AAV4VRG2_9ARAC|nr:hypothetical protein CDAR_67911 [Caerostris darwini]